MEIYDNIETIEGDIYNRIYETFEYGKFTLLDTNRNLNSANLKKIIESMEEEYLRIPIIVNEKYEIIDGQHRFHGAKHLNLPVRYIINVGYGIEQVKRANTSGVNWTRDDFLKTYIKEGNRNYIEFAELKKETGLSVISLLKIFGGFMDMHLDNVTTIFNNGNFQIEPHFDAVKGFCEHLKICKEYKDYRSGSFIQAFLHLYLHEDYDPQHMEKQAKKAMQWFNPSSKTKEVLLEELCTKVYSYRMLKKEGRILYSKHHKRFFQ
jgi:hypothetical protein